MPMKVNINKYFEKTEHNDVVKIFCPSILGDSTILENHISLVTEIKGTLELFFNNGKSESIDCPKAIFTVDNNLAEVFI
jgi:F0F1-type ATP synthase epsilon subunit